MEIPRQHERRSRQRFEFQLPVTLRVNGNDHVQPGFTQDLSARGVFLYTDTCVKEGEAVELTLIMPSEITLTENMPVRCRGKVLRVVEHEPINHKVGIAVEFQGYEYLPQQEDANQTSSDFARITRLHEHALEETLIPPKG
jgi:hypothetical protein